MIPFSDSPSRTHAARAGRAVVAVVLSLIGVALVGGVALAVSGGLGSSGKKGAATAELARAEVMDFEISTTSSGELEARNQVEIRSKLESPATIVEVVPEGTRVKKGDVLVRLNADEIESKITEESLRVEQAKAELLAARNAYEIQLTENDSRLRQATLKLELAKLSLQQWIEGDDKQKRLTNELALDKGKRDLDRLKNKFEQSKMLIKEGFLSQDEYDMDEIRLKEAEAALEKADLQNNAYENYQRPKDEKSRNSDVQQAQSDLEVVKRKNEIEKASKDATLKNRERQLQIHETRLAKLEEQNRNTVITAPTDGLVVYATSLNSGRGWMMFNGDGPLQIGRRVNPNELLIALPDTSEMVASVRVHESLAGRIKPGQPVSIRIEAVEGESFSGRVDSIGVLAESGGWRDPNLREYTVKISLDQSAAAGGLKPSMRCEAKIQLGTVQNALSVPIQAVFNDGPVRYVYTKRGSKFAKRPVKVGRRSELWAQILAGLEEGDTVLVREPAPAEVLGTPWNPAQLKLVGLHLNDEGQPVPIASGSPMRPGFGPGRSMRRHARPPGTGPAAKASPAVPAASTEATAKEDPDQQSKDKSEGK